MLWWYKKNTPTSVEFASERLQEQRTTKPKKIKQRYNCIEKRIFFLRSSVPFLAHCRQAGGLLKDSIRGLSSERSITDCKQQPQKLASRAGLCNRRAWHRMLCEIIALRPFSASQSQKETAGDCWYLWFEIDVYKAAVAGARCLW